MEASTDVMDVTWMMETTQYEEVQPQQPYYELYTAARFITGLILYPIICLFGLTGNALIIVVLAHKVALSSTDVLLTPSCICLRLSSCCACIRPTDHVLYWFQTDHILSLFETVHIMYFLD